jgi:carbonic anhydrase/acetyltransferase-like protein (isoleucine patch superfamily)
MTILQHHGVVPVIHPAAFVAQGACLIGDVTVGEDASIWFNAVLRGDINGIAVGRRANVQDGAVVHVTREFPVLIEEEVTVGHQAMLHGCRVLRRSLIGMNAIVLDNAVVGPFSIVGAGAVVREHSVVPEGVLVAGVPARVVRPLSEEERVVLAQSAENYVQYARSYRAP